MSEAAPPPRRDGLESLDAAADAFEHLVNQFADPLACVRELVQNSLDAGSAEIEVSCRFQTASQEDPQSGTAIISVEDWGEGMDRAIIDSRLTRLFSSDKEGDRTKIGKFGIGFVSVFAISPDAVCVDTGRAGESWRVLFRADRTFSRIRLPQPVDGTKVQILKRMPFSEFQKLEERLSRLLRYHCQHVEGELRYQGQPLSRPLDLDVPVKVAAEQFGATLVAGLSTSQEPATASFYNRGLALLTRKSEFPEVVYKVNSPRLEHTLSRDNVIQDDHYTDILGAVKQLVHGPLVEELFLLLEQALSDGNQAETARYLQAHVAALLRVRRADTLPRSCLGRAALRSPEGKLYSLSAALKALEQGRLFLASTASPLSQAAAAQGLVVVDEQDQDLVEVLCEKPQRLEARYLLPLRLPAPQPPSPEAPEQLLALAVHRLLSLSGLPVLSVERGSLQYPGSAVGHWPAALQKQPFTLGELADANPQKLRRRDTNVAWILNDDHPTVKILVALARVDRELAAYTLIKLCLLGGALTAELDTLLLSLALEERCRRLQPKAPEQAT